jgi:hypothetical protein
MKGLRVYAVCDTCRLRHRTPPGSRDGVEFFARHAGHSARLMTANPVAEWLLDRFGWQGYGDNANAKEAFGTSTGITCTLASLAQAAARESTALDNTSNLYLDAFVYLAVALQTGSPASDKGVYVYAYGSEDGTNYGDNATGTDAAVTLRAPHNFRLIGFINTPDSGALTYKSPPFSVAAAFGGLMPRKWGIVVENKTNLTFNATEGNHTKSYSGVYTTVA